MILFDYWWAIWALTFFVLFVVTITTIVHTLTEKNIDVTNTQLINDKNYPSHCMEKLALTNNVNEKFFVVTDLYDSIVSGSVREKKILYSTKKHEKYIKKYAKNQTVLDIGTNIGTHVLMMSPYAKKIYAFEPNPMVYNITEANIALNGLQNKVVLTKNAASDVVGEFEMVVESSDHNQGGISIRKQNSKTVKIKSIVIDDMNISENISFIKIDVEGHEVRALTGAKKLLLKNKPVILYEDHTHSDVEKFLRTLGYNDFERITGLDHIAKII